jgi:penicillin-binding protein 1B
VQLGLEQAPAAYPSMLLGATNLSPFDVAQMYNTLANGGFRSPLRAVRAVLDESGKAAQGTRARDRRDRGIRRRSTALDRMLIEVMDRGTGRAARRDLPGHHVARQDRYLERLSRQLVRGILGAVT